VEHPLPWLRYVDAGDVEVADVDFDGLRVRNEAMERLGTVDGFVLDNASMRPYYLVVDSGGWFRTRHFLVPIGHARLDDDRDAIVVDIPKQRIDRFPGFDRGQFETLGQDDIRRMNDDICTITSGTTVTYAAGDPMSAAWNRPEYRQPDWWTATADQVKTSRPHVGRTPADAAGGTVARATGELQAERELARDRDRQHQRELERDRGRQRERELVTAQEPDPSPHFDGRAQPGDVLGVETGGEQTHIGETAADENKRRIDAERAEEKRRK
jgi:hypothetical protein